MDGDTCPAVDFITEGEASTSAYRSGLAFFLQRTAEVGLQGIPSAWYHEASKEDGIYEFIKGPLRLFFFKGVNGEVAVCTSGTRKNSSKADKKSVRRAVDIKEAYFKAIETNTYQKVDDENQ